MDALWKNFNERARCFRLVLVLGIAVVSNASGGAEANHSQGRDLNPDPSNISEVTGIGSQSLDSDMTIRDPAYHRVQLQYRRVKHALDIAQSVKLLTRGGVGVHGATPTNLARANLRRAQLSNAALAAADLTEADLSFAILNGADLHSAN